MYAIVRSECLRKLRARKRVAYGGEEQLVQMADDALTPDQEAERAAMQKIVWDASAGLADRDRALLDLHLRQGLEGAELGEAMGVSASNAYVMLAEQSGLRKNRVARWMWKLCRIDGRPSRYRSEPPVAFSQG